MACSLKSRGSTNHQPTRCASPPASMATNSACPAMVGWRNFKRFVLYDLSYIPPRGTCIPRPLAAQAGRQKAQPCSGPQASFPPGGGFPGLASGAALSAPEVACTCEPCDTRTVVARVITWIYWRFQIHTTLTAQLVARRRKWCLHQQGSSSSQYSSTNTSHRRNKAAGG